LPPLEPCMAVCKKMHGVFKKDYEPYQTMGPLCRVQSSQPGSKSSTLTGSRLRGNSGTRRSRVSMKVCGNSSDPVQEEEHK